MERETVEIIKRLEKVTASGMWASDIFDDWLDMTKATLERLPEHLKSARQNGVMAEDTEETQKLWARLRDRYKKPWYFEQFSAAFNILLESTSEYKDVIGEVYMEFGIPNKGTGQFFTPWPLSKMMANLISGMDEIYRMLADAYSKSSYGLMQKVLYGDIDQAEVDQRLLAFVKRMGADVIPLCAEHVKPITVSDPACGSGVMFLANASSYDPWVHQWGLVRYYGQDIDQTCVKMAQTNMMLYGLSGYQLKCALALSDVELSATPEPYRSAYRDARVAKEAGDDERVIEITQEIRAWQQPALF